MIRNQWDHGKSERTMVNQIIAIHGVKLYKS